MLRCPWRGVQTMPQPSHSPALFLRWTRPQSCCLDGGWTLGCTCSTCAIWEGQQLQLLFRFSLFSDTRKKHSLLSPDTGRNKAEGRSSALSTASLAFSPSPEDFIGAQHHQIQIMLCQHSPKHPTSQISKSKTFLFLVLKKRERPFPVFLVANQGKLLPLRLQPGRLQQ